jgi:hypothetical protein
MAVFFLAPPLGTWHYLAQVLQAGAAGAWQLSRFSLHSPSPFGSWVPNPANPVVHGGQLFNQICSGAGKHCEVGMVDEGTPEIVLLRVASLLLHSMAMTTPVGGQPGALRARRTL